MNNAKHILIFEPQIEGHHLTWLAALCEDFLSAGYTLSLALDTRENIAQERLLAINSTLLDNVNILPTFTPKGTWIQRDALHTLAHCFKQSGAERLFVNNLDEFTSKLFRRALFGLRPPSILKSKISGIYHRPRPLDFSQTSLNNQLKRCGLKRLCREGWFDTIFLLDEHTLENIPQNTFLGTHFSWLPDPGISNISTPQHEARKSLGIPQDRIVFLNYGVAARRKGLHLALKALQHLPEDRFFLLSAGRLGDDREVLNGMKQLEAKGCAKALNYYVSPEEEVLAFCAADMVLLPYISHFGLASVLARAISARRPVIASDYHLLGMRVKRYGLGLTFKNESVEDLRRVLEEVLEHPEKHLTAYHGGLEAYAHSFSREAFRQALLTEPFKETQG